MAIQALRSQLAQIIGRTLRRVGLRPVTWRYPGEIHGTPTISYRRHPGLGEAPGPGDVVWTWVPFEEDRRQGKGRPFLVMGYDGPWLLALPLTSKRSFPRRLCVSQPPSPMDGHQVRPLG